ncbi:expressed protein [Echinococcus multilocularis]|uniref:Expressed protein n=1 Tax=Echinococcus multilocularis TaxID=6211 RepID=A0A068XYF2_ECHMU|nr:expressed protein [Echinococcus multilocularis]
MKSRLNMGLMKRVGSYFIVITDWKVSRVVGHTVKIEKIPNVRDILEVWLQDEKIYRCNIRELQFGGDGFLDKKAREISQKIKESYHACYASQSLNLEVGIGNTP